MNKSLIAALMTSAVLVMGSASTFAADVAPAAKAPAMHHVAVKKTSG